MTKFYIDTNGRYLGGFEIGAPAGAIEVPSAPDHALKIWNGSAWVDTAAYTTAINREKLVATDAGASRLGEDALTALHTAGTIVLTNEQKTRINARRILRGESPL